MFRSILERNKRLKVTFKVRQEWWSRVFASPVAHTILCLIADLKFITPNRLTLFSFLLTIIVAVLIFTGSSIELKIAGILLQTAYIFDCMDGQLARYRNISSELGSFLDKSLDYFKISILIFAITMESLHRTERDFALFLGFSCMFLTCFLPYLKSMIKADYALEDWKILTGPSFSERNLRFFLFEEAQWYLIITICLLFNRGIWALWTLCLTQGVVAIFQLGRVINILNIRKRMT